MGVQSFTAFVGAGSGANQTGVTITGAGLVLLLQFRTGANLGGLPAFSYALETAGGSAVLDNFADLAVSAGSLVVKINNTGAAVATQTISTGGGNTVSIGFTDGTNGTDNQTKNSGRRRRQHNLGTVGQSGTPSPASFRATLGSA